MNATSLTVFTPLTKGFVWQLSTTAAGGGALPPGEVETGVTIGIRADGDASHGVGNYQWLYVAPAGATNATRAQIEAQLKTTLPVGNYWANLDQTDALGGNPSTSGWEGEIPFSIPAVVAQPASPTLFTVS